MANIEELKRIASQVRRDIIRMVTDAQSGHPGGSLSSADILTALYFNEMKIDPSNWSRESKGEDVLSFQPVTSLRFITHFFPEEDTSLYLNWLHSVDSEHVFRDILA